MKKLYARMQDHPNDIPTGPVNIDHAAAKESIRNWDSVAAFGSTFPDGDGTGACDVQVQIGEAGGNWYLRTSDDAGGSDDCDATPYVSLAAAVSAARDYAAMRDECESSIAEKWLKKQTADQIEEGKSEDGEYVLAHKDGTRWDDDRYSDRDAAEAAIKSWYDSVQAGNPGTIILWHLMDTPELATLSEDGEIEMEKLK